MTLEGISLYETVKRYQMMLNKYAANRTRKDTEP